MVTKNKPPFFGLIGKYSIKFRWIILILWVAATILIAKELPSLSSVTQSNNSSFLPSTSATEKAIALTSAFGKNSSNQPVPVVIATSSGTVLSAANQQAIATLEQKLIKIDGVQKVENAGSSGDGQAEELIVEANVQSKGGGEDIGPFINSLRSAIQQSNLPANLQAHLAGDVATAADNSSSSGKTNTHLQLFSALFIIVLLLIIFKAPLAPFITLIPAALVVVISGPLIAEAANHGLKVSSLAQLLLTVLILGAGTDYGLFLIFRVREELRHGLDKNEAIVTAMSRVGESITFSAATVIAALLSLLFATFQIYSNLGIPLAIGIGLMLLAGLTLTPALLAIFGRAVFWPMHKPTKGVETYGVWGRVCARVVAHPVLVLVVGVVLFGSLALAIPGYKAGGFAGNTSAPAGSDSAEGNALLAKHFPASSANPTEVVFVLKQSVWQAPAILTAIQTDLSSSPLFKSVSGPLNPNGFTLSPTQIVALHKIYTSSGNVAKGAPSSAQLKAAAEYRVLANYISSDGKSLIYSASLSAGDPGSTTAMSAVPSIRNTVTSIANKVGAQDSGVVGEAPALYDINSISASDLVRVVPIAIIVIGILLALLMRSLVAPIYLIASVALSYLAALGLSVLVFIDIDKGSGLVFILPFLMFLFLLALGEDYNILVMTRIREEAALLPLKEAVPKALNTTGTTVTSAGLVLAGTFTVFAIVGGSGSGGSEVSNIGFGLAAGIIMDTFLVRTLLVPSIVVLLGRWNWWPSKHGSWVYQD